MATENLSGLIQAGTQNSAYVGLEITLGSNIVSAKSDSTAVLLDKTALLRNTISAKASCIETIFLEKLIYSTIQCNAVSPSEITTEDIREQLSSTVTAKSDCDQSILTKAVIYIYAVSSARSKGTSQAPGTSTSIFAETKSSSISTVQTMGPFNNVCGYVRPSQDHVLVTPGAIFPFNKVIVDPLNNFSAATAQLHPLYGAGTAAKYYIKVWALWQRTLPWDEGSWVSLVVINLFTSQYYDQVNYFTSATEHIDVFYQQLVCVMDFDAFPDPTEVIVFVTEYNGAGSINLLKSGSGMTFVSL